MSVPNTFNPSDYEYLLKSLVDGTPIAKSESLKRFNTLVGTDKKQFSVYAKRIVLALQDLMCEHKEEISLLASMLVLEIINLNPKDIEYYIRTKLLRQIVANLGDPKPQLRKTSHYSLLAFVKTFKTFDEVVTMYLDVGFNSGEPQLRQKCINSFQSIIITDMKCINWNSVEFKKLFQSLLQRIKDESPYVQKAAEQCLLTISRMQEIKAFVKKLSPTYFNIYRIFCDAQRQLGNLPQVSLESNDKMVKSHKSLLNSTPSQSHRSDKNSNQLMLNMQKINLIRQDSINKQAIIERIEQIRRHSHTPRMEDQSNKNLIKKSQSISPNKDRDRDRLLPPFSAPKEERKIQTQRTLPKQIEKIKQVNESSLRASPKPHPIIFVTKTEKVENIFGKKLLEDLKNDKDWKVRLQAIEELQAKFQIYKEAFDIQSLMKNFVPILIKLLADQNFKIALISLKIIEQILKLPLIKLQLIVPQVLDKLNDNKIALRQNVSKLIRSQYLSTNNQIWITCLLDQLKKTPFPNIREEVLNILAKLYEQQNLSYPYQRIVDEICPMMDDLKTKIKIRTLDLLVLITIKTQKVDNIKSILLTKMNQVYYEMYVEKVGKELKSIRSTPNLSERAETSQRNREKQSKTVAFPSLKKNKNSATNTTSTSLQKYSKTIEAKPLSLGSSFAQKEKQSQSFVKSKIENLEIFSSRNLNQLDNLSDIQRGNLTPSDNIRRKPLKNYKKKLQRTLQSKLTTNYTGQNQNLRPLADPQKQLKGIVVDIKSQDWQVSFDSLTKLRRILQFHPDAMSINIGKSLVADIMKHVQSLRSSLSKNAVITINDLSNTLKRNLDAELDTIFNKLVRKTLDTNSFISEEVKKALISVCTHCNQSKVISLLYSFHSSKALPIKQTVMYILESITFIPKVYEKQLDRIVNILVDFMSEGSLEIREKTKVLMNQIIDREKANSKIYKLIPIDLLDKFKKKETLPEALTLPPKKQVSQIEISPAKKKKQKIIIFPNQFNDFEDLLKRAESNEWKIRQQTLTRMLSIAKTYPQQISQHKMGSKVMDIASKQLNDPNSKVSANALILLKQIIPITPKLIESNLSIVINELFTCFASHKNEIRESALQLFDVVSQNVEKWMLIQHLCNGALYGATRSKASILVKLLKILPICYRDKKAVVSKNVYSMINKLVEQTKSETQPILKQLVTICLNLGGDDAVTALKQPAKDLAIE